MIHKVTLKEWWRLFRRSFCWHRWTYKGDSPYGRVYYCTNGCGFYVKVAKERDA